MPNDDISKSFKNDEHEPYANIYTRHPIIMHPGTTSTSAIKENSRGHQCEYT